MRKALASLLYVFLGLPLALSALLTISVRPWALDRDFYRRLVSDDRLYEALRLGSPADRGREAPGLRPRGEQGGAVYDDAALAEALRKNLPEEQVRALALRAVDEAMDLVEGRDRDGRFDLDLKPLKSAIASRGPAIARDYVAALPSRPELPAPGDFSYRPASLSPKAAEARMSAAIGERLGALPDAVTRPFDARVAVSGGAKAFLTRALLDRVAASLAAAALLVIGGVAALGGAGIAGRLAKAGRYILGPSIVVLALGVLLYLPGAPFLMKLLPAEARDLLAGPAAAALGAYLSAVLGVVAKGFFLTGLIGASAGGMLASAERIAAPKEIE